MKGRKPLPAAVKELKGNPGKRPIKPGLRVPPAAPDPPAWLSPGALEEWRRVSGLLSSIGILSEFDRAALAAYCTSYARWVQCEEWLAGNPEQRETRAFTSQERTAEKLLSIIRAYCAEFGFTPSSRARMDVAQAPVSEADALDQFISG